MTSPLNSAWTSLSPAAAPEGASFRGNARLVEIVPIHEELRLFRVQSDAGPLARRPGQYTTLGLPASAPYLDAEGNCQRLPPEGNDRLIQRAYSFSSRVLDASGQLVDPCTEEPIEFYITLVPAGPQHPPGLTPRLFALQPGDRLQIGRHVKGNYVLQGISDRDDLVFAATGTGEAPHNTMIADLLRRGHRGRIVSIVCTRYRRDLGYADVHRRLERKHLNYRYLTLTTREPENLVESQPGYVGRRYLQEYLLSADVEHALGRRLRPGGLHLFLCGSPAMIGAPQRTAAGELNWPRPTGALEILSGRGFRISDHGHAGEVHYEKYW